jgi:signal peptidase I
MDAPSDEAASGTTPSTTRRGRALREFAVIAAAAVVIALLVKSFLVQVFYVPSDSMRPTIQPDDRIVVCRICTRIGGVDRGEVIVFDEPGPDEGGIGAALRGLVEGLGVASPEHPDFVKRVVGLPGDVIEIRDGVVTVDGVALDEPYLDPRIDTRPYGPIEVPDGMLFVLGDNRIDSGDSRFEPPGGVGLVPDDDVIGEVVWIVWPPSRLGTLG